jgi:hypothetical protein
LLAIGLLPVVVVGAALTLSVFGAYFGLPVLLLAGRPWWRAQQAARGRSARCAPVHTVIAVGTLSAALLVSAVFGLNDFDSVDEVGVSAVILALGAACWAGTIDLIRVGRPPKAP